MLYNLQRRNELVEGNNPLLAIERLINAISRLEQNQAATFPLAENRDGVACKRKNWTISYKKNFGLLKRKSSKSKINEVRNSSYFGVSYQESWECV